MAALGLGRGAGTGGERFKGQVFFQSEENALTRGAGMAYTPGMG